MSSPSLPRHSTNSIGNHAGSMGSPTSSNNKAVFEGGGFAANLPKGGGAIRGIDEKISVDGYRGTARLTVPLPINPVRGGIGPELSMDYESGAGNGPFGIAWSVNAPAIVRRTDKGIPRYADDIDSDGFLAPGTDELVRVADDRGNAIVRYHSPNGSLLPSAPAAEHYEVRPYRPRVDNAFSRIEWWRMIAPRPDGSRACSNSFWRIISRTNVTSLYGFSSGSQLRAANDPDDAPRIFQWQIERSFDDRGNAVQYEYSSDDGELANQPFASPRYLVSAKYGNRTAYDRRNWLKKPFPAEPQAGTSPWLFELALDYGLPIGTPSKNISDLLAGVEQPADKDRRVAPSEGPVRPDSFASYRSGFAIRTRRLCRRILSYHRIPGGYDGLCRSLELTYDENPYLSKLIAITQVAWDGPAGKAFPPLQLCYAEVPDLAKARVERLAPDALPTLRATLDRPRYAFIDLDAEGAPGALFQSSGGAWLFARNSGGGRFTAPQPVDYQPALAGVAGANATTPAVTLLDLNGNGLLDLVEFGRPSTGFRERASDYTWDRFIPFTSSPALNPDDPNVRFFDLDGDGLSDLVWSEQGAYFWQRSLGEAGFAAPERLTWASEEKNGPRLLFADRNNTVYLADVSGDGLTDLVRIRNGEVCYWPNLGRGRFGPRTALTLHEEDGTDTGEQVAFDRSELFSASRIRLLDIDGTGSTDLAYLGANGLRCWRNQSGNGFSRPVTIPFPPVDDPGAVSVVDLLANGTSCLVFAPATPDPSVSIQYLHLVGAQSADPRVPPDTSRAQKPHLLVRHTNNLGGETFFHYTTSAQFCVQDRDNGQPWVTKLGFPVQVIERVEYRDLVTGKILSNSYRYRHGHYDGQEREFCGFAFVEQQDSVRYEDFSGSGTAAFASAAANADAKFHLPPAVVRTWFHTGAVLKGETLSRRLASEYFCTDADAALLPDTALPELREAETREAVRALKGSMLRQEVYSGEDDGSVLPGAWPYTVSERNYVVRRLQATGANRHAVFQVHPAQQIDYHYEQQPDDPRIEHQFTLEVDQWGNVLQSAHAAYGRRAAGLMRDIAFLSEQEREIQGATSLDYSLKRYTEAIADPISDPLDHQAALLCEAIDCEITGVPPTGPKGFYQPSDLRALHSATGLAELPYQAAASAPAARRRIEHNRLHYWDTTQAKALPLGRIAIPALPHQTFKLALTPDMLSGLVAEAGEPIDPDQLILAGYRRRRDLPFSQFAATSTWPDDADAESWWAPSPFQQHDAAAFFVPIRHFDSFYATTTQRFGVGALMPERVVDPLENETRIKNDYRLLQPQQITDANGSVTELRFDLRGMVAAMALRGNEPRPTKDSLAGISANLAAADVEKFFENPTLLAQPGSGSIVSIRNATSRFVYDVFAACNVEQPVGVFALDPAPAGRKIRPVWAATLARQFHVVQDADAPIEIAFAYSNGFGEVAQTKQLTAPGPLDPAGPAGTRWIGSGWQIHDNKNSVVRQYEPFFTATHDFERGRIEGATVTTLYDPLQRVRATLVPHRVLLPSGAVAQTAPVGHSYEKHIHRAWGDTTWDGNDTVLLDPLADPDVRAFFRKLPPSDFQPSWHQQRIDPALNRASWPADERRQRWEREAALCTAAHAATPARNFLDPRGRVFLSVVHHRRELEGPDEFMHTRTDYDIEGNQRAVVDAMQRPVMRWDYFMVGLPWRSHSMDGGKRLMLAAVDGKPVLEWDAMNRRIVHEFDSLRRPIKVRVREAGSEHIRESYAYGESLGDGAARYLRGRLHQQQDDAGTLTISRYDWHGQPVSTARAFALDGNTVRSREDSFDAQSRLVRSACDSATVSRKYSTSGQLIEVASSPGGTVVAGIEYRPSGQRALLRHSGEGPGIRYVFDSLTGRLHFQQAREFQYLHHVFDPVGSITHIADDSLDVEFYAGQRIEPLQQFTYDSLYRLATASGREHCSRTSGTWNERFADGSPFDLGAHPNDQHAFRNYSETYHYDSVGNLLRQRHVAGSGSWTRSFDVEILNNRLRNVSVGALNVETLQYDDHGNVVRMAHLSSLAWDCRDRLVSAVRGGDRSRFAYDAAGQRAAKSEPRGTRCYFGEFEFFSTGLATHSSVIRDGAGILAIVDHAGGGNAQVRLQLPNHLGSCGVEIDRASGDLIAREEFYPYGGTSFQAPTSGAAARRYRFTAKERDESTGLNYHGARYYAPWLGRWISTDPIATNDGPNQYSYVGNNPTCNVDPTGQFESKPDSYESKPDARRALAQAEGSTTKGSVGAPGFKESLIPVWGSGRESINHLQEGHYAKSAFWGVLAITDVFLVKSLVTRSRKNTAAWRCQVIGPRGGATLVAQLT
ncbi:SpvB/TcaC N-terminal domain-containing protein [Bradyrhizobium sp. AZCC 1693]|uniref:SpvB/TcaC N-terminal domain-containing protein n=1 Tax=Bradyrhizobium sp. AZCC 1693 TaxID=3117029 RepID=UPI002FF3B02F